MRHRVGAMLWLLIVWVALWESASLGTILGGVVVGSVLVAMIPPRTHTPAGRLRPWYALRFFVFFLWKLAEASAIVAWEIVTPANRIREGIVAIPVRGTSDLLTTVVANAISLTPGTITIEVTREPTVLYVHVLHLMDLDRVRRDVHRLEEYAIRAFGSDDAVRALARRDVGGEH